MQYRKFKEKDTFVSKDEAYMLLANAIIKHAANDYRRLLRGKKTVDNDRKIADIERFFRSDYFLLLSDADGEMILQKLSREKEKTMGLDLQNMKDSNPDAARNERLAYYRAWRSKNRDRVKRYNAQYLGHRAMQKEKMLEMELQGTVKSGKTGN